MMEGPSSHVSDEQSHNASMHLPECMAAAASAADQSGLECSCFDPNCKLKKYYSFHTRLQGEKQRPQSPSTSLAATATVLTTSSSILKDPNYPLGSLREKKLLEDSPDLAEAHFRLAQSGGGAQVCRAVYDCCQELAGRQPQVLAASDGGDGGSGGDTVLMQLCNRRPADQRQRRLLSAQILAFSRLYLERAPELLFSRNSRGTSALELAALSDKAEAAVFLSLLQAALGKDPNESNSEGHTVLHLLARKGDDCSHTLERLLRLRSSQTDCAGIRQRLFRLDVVNCGRKTPLDVAVACKSLFSAGPNRAVYDCAIAAFHQVIEEDAREMFENSGGGADSRQMTFRNF